MRSLRAALAHRLCQTQPRRAIFPFGSRPSWRLATHLSLLFGVSRPHLRRRGIPTRTALEALGRLGRLEPSGHARRTGTALSALARDSGKAGLVDAAHLGRTGKLGNLGLALSRARYLAPSWYRSHHHTLTLLSSYLRRYVDSLSNAGALACGIERRRN